MRDLFLKCGGVVAGALGDPSVESNWDKNSILEGQTIGTLTGHLSRGVFTAGIYLDDEPPTVPLTFDSAAAYYSILTEKMDENTHEGIRERSAGVASVGPLVLAKQVATEVERLRLLLLAEPKDRCLAVFGGSMTLDDYLGTRIIELVVHLGDLAQSLKVEPWALPPRAEAFVVSCGAEIGMRRMGAQVMIQALYRDGGSELPVI